MNLTQLKKVVASNKGKILQERYDIFCLEYKIKTKGIEIVKITVAEAIPENYGVLFLVPEEIKSIPVYCIIGSAFDSLIENGFWNIIVPSCVKTIKKLDYGNCKLNDIVYCKEELNIYVARSSYQNYRLLLEESKKRTIRLYENIFAYFRLVIDWNDWQDYFINLKGIWDYKKNFSWPSDEKWVDENYLIAYTGDKEIVIKENSVENRAFFMSNVEEIIFSQNTDYFYGKIIAQCPKLKKIYFLTAEEITLEESCICDCDVFGLLSMGAGCVCMMTESISYLEGPISLSALLIAASSGIASVYLLDCQYDFLNLLLPLSFFDSHNMEDEDKADIEGINIEEDLDEEEVENVNEKIISISSRRPIKTDKWAM